MQTVKLNVHVPSIGSCDVHVRTHRPAAALLRTVGLEAFPAPERVAFAAAYNRQAGTWVLPETPESVQELLDAAGVVLR